MSSSDSNYISQLTCSSALKAGISWRLFKSCNFLEKGSGFFLKYRKQFYDYLFVTLRNNCKSIEFIILVVINIHWY